MRDNFDAEPFTVAEPVVVDLRDRLDRTRWAIEAAAPSWPRSTSPVYLRGVVGH